LPTKKVHEKNVILSLCYSLCRTVTLSYSVISLAELQPAELRVHGTTWKSARVRSGSNTGRWATGTGNIHTGPCICLSRLHVWASHI